MNLWLKPWVQPKKRGTAVPAKEAPRTLRIGLLTFFRDGRYVYMAPARPAPHSIPP